MTRGRNLNRCEVCKLYQSRTQRVCIPPPLGEIRGCLISRDPTFPFLEKLKEFKQFPPDNGLLWFDAPPLWLYKKIAKFKNLPENSEDMIKLHHFLEGHCYWTHLHKCPTYNSREKQYQYRPFQYATGKVCASNWFEDEFAEYRLKEKIIILLGNDVKKFFDNWAKMNCFENSENVIRLPHPSGRNRLWNRNTTKKDSIVNEINYLMQLI